jgi:hypothetical protein
MIHRIRFKIIVCSQILIFIIYLYVTDDMPFHTNRIFPILNQKQHSQDGIVLTWN